MREQLDMDELLKTYAEVKPVRYLVTSAIDFKEIVSTTNLIFARVGSLGKIETLERNSILSVIPLPASNSRFIVCFDVPCLLLGESKEMEDQRIDFSGFSLSDGQFDLESYEQGFRFRYQVDSLFDANLILVHFDRLIANIVDGANRLKLKRAVALRVYPANGDGGPNCLEFEVPHLTPEQATSLQEAVSALCTKG